MIHRHVNYIKSTWKYLIYIKYTAFKLKTCLKIMFSMLMFEYMIYWQQSLASNDTSHYGAVDDQVELLKDDTVYI